MDQIFSSFLCHHCRTHTWLNVSTVCLGCRRLIPDITASIPKQVDLTYCPHCNTYRHPPEWAPTALQPNELLSFLVKNLRGLDGALLGHSEFDWAPDLPPRAVRVRFTFHKESRDGLSTKACTVRYDVHEGPCWPCILARLDQTALSATVHILSQAPQTLLDLDPLLLLADDDSVIERLEGRIDILFKKPGDAHDLVVHLSWPTLVRLVRDELYIFQDKMTETPLCKYAASVKVSPIRVGDLVCLPSWTSGHLGNLGPFVLCDYVSGGSIVFLDPLDSRRGFLDTDEFWRLPFQALLSREDLVEYVVVDVEGVFLDSQFRRFVGEVRVGPTFGSKEEEVSFDVRTHLRGELEEGDYVLGYDLLGSGILDGELDKYKDVDVPHVVLVEKSGWIEEDSEDEDDL